VAKQKILIIDDELPMRFLLETQLRRSGFSVCSAADGPSGLRLALQEQPDLIILDVMMPAMNGFEVCAEIRRRPELAQTPVIFVTASMTRENKARVFDAGANDYVVKPFHTDELLAHITAVLQRRRPDPQPAARGRSIALFGAEAGVGTTTLAIQLGEALALRSPQPLALVDLDLPYGSIASTLKLYTDGNIVELLNQPQLDLPLLHTFAQRQRTNLLVFPAPGRAFDLAQTPQPAQLQKFLGLLAADGYHVILDLGAQVTELALAALRAVDLAYIVTSGQPHANARHDTFMASAAGLGLELRRLLPVVNDVYGTAAKSRLAYKPLARILQATEQRRTLLWLQDQGMQKLLSVALL